MVDRGVRSTRRRFTSRKKTGVAQAFKQAPWRNQVRFVGLFLLGLVVVILTASVYLSISGRAAAAGLNAYRMNLERLDLERQIADRKAQIAILTSTSVMEERARSMGFEQIDSSQAVYVSVPGYTGRKPVVLAPPPGYDDSERLIIRSIYRQSLWDWMFSGINRLSDSVRGGTY